MPGHETRIICGLNPDDTASPIRVLDEATARFAAFDVSAAGSNIVIAGVMQRRIKVVQMLLMASDDVDVDVRDWPGGTILVGTLSLAADGNGFVLPPAPPGQPWFQTETGDGLDIFLSAAVQCGGCIVYYVE